MKAELSPEESVGQGNWTQTGYFPVPCAALLSFFLETHRIPIVSMVRKRR
jgi:hypothetical protein